MIIPFISQMISLLKINNQYCELMMIKRPDIRRGVCFSHLFPLDLAAGVGGFVGGAGEAGDQAAADGALSELYLG